MGEVRIEGDDAGLAKPASMQPAKFVRRTNTEFLWPDDDRDAHSGGASFEQRRSTVGRPVIDDKHVAS